MYDMKSKTLVFSLGQYEYDKAFASAVNTHKKYSERFGYSYCCVSEDGNSLLGRENIWIKTLLFYGALLKNDYVLYVDTDVEFKEICPPVTEAVSRDCPIGVVEGHSGRVNAGVIFAAQTPYSLKFFAQWVASLGKPLEPRHDVGWGENGHLIRLVEVFGIEPLETRWNNTFDPDLDDYLRHYTGPLRSEYEFNSEEKVAWNNILKTHSASKAQDNIDIITSLYVLKEVYSRSAPSEYFASFDECWEHVRELVFTAGIEARTNNLSKDHQIYIAEEIGSTVPNAYVATLRDGLRRVHGAENIKTGVSHFWEHPFAENDILHIEWIESLFNWKVPSEEQVVQYEARMKEIAQTSPIVYTAHNFDLMPTYGDMRVRMMQAVADNATLICHLSNANIAAYKEHHSSIRGLDKVATSIVPHGDYQPYFRENLVDYEDPALLSEKIKILIFGHIRTEAELQFCLETGECLGEDRFQLIFMGPVNTDVIHWRVRQHLRDEWDGGPRRVHYKVPDEQVVSLFSQVDCVLIPRINRLNSGVQFVAYSLLKPVFVPAQHSMEEIQNKIAGCSVYSVGNAKHAAQLIEEYFKHDIANRLTHEYLTNDFNYAQQDSYVVGLSHLIAYKHSIDCYNNKVKGAL
ncbi:hypothetical protein [Roseibium sediminicola]|uniref:Uncharacterized protein n=1 Tax=Roseibium sediminicola TaxID=2933272 RepID=A0ABT0H3H5_9HYPH|nr:hypothetical protein [Roseibium sp. CAU 1639]MCK7616250.1 hypothetical protein [Roseibium sp. CAU 1639]